MKLTVIDKGVQDYASCWQAMRAFTDQRDIHTLDEVWFVEHPAVFTQGQAGKPEHVLNPGEIPIIKSDRGGQITYHGPGQLVMYTLLDLRRLRLGIRPYVAKLEQVIIDCLALLGITAAIQCGAPGVYVDGKKICSLGLRVRNGCCYHGLALNIDMDLEPFKRINPCGFEALQMTQLRDFDITVSLEQIKDSLLSIFNTHLHYQTT